MLTTYDGLVLFGPFLAFVLFMTVMFTIAHIKGWDQ
jgi:hypothetical protein